MGFYKVKQGDTLNKLAQLFNTTVENLQTLNNLKNPNSIFIGQNIKFEEENCENWQDCDGDNKVSYGDFQGCGNYTLFLDKISKYIGLKWDNNLAKEILSLYKQIVKNPKQANFLGLSINDKTIPYDGNSNFYRNNLDTSLAKYSLSDNNSPTKIEINVYMGKETSFRDRKVYDFLNKVLGDNLDNTSEVVKNGSHSKIITTRLENSDLYKAFISVNPNISTKEQNGKYKDDVFVKNYQGKVQIPVVKINSNGVKYFTLQKADGTILFFDEKGHSVKSIDEIQEKDVMKNKVDIPQNITIAKQTNEYTNDFVEKEDFKNDKLNIGKLYIDGKIYDKSLYSNYYQNSLDNSIGAISLDSSEINKIEIQLKAGKELNNEYDLSPKDILKKFLGNNLNNTTSYKEGKLETQKLENTDLYKKFIEINPELLDFKAGDTINIQFPALKITPSGEKYFTIINSSNQVLFFDEYGNM